MLAQVVVQMIVAGATLAAKGAAEEFGKGAGEQVLKRLASRIGIAEEAVSEPEKIKVREKALANQIEESGALNDQQTLELIEELRSMLESDRENLGAYGIVASDFKSEKDIIARHVDGMKNVNMHAGNNIEITNIRSPGK